MRTLSKSEIIVTLQIALILEIPRSARAVAYKYDPQKQFFLLRYYVDIEPNDDHYNHLNCVMGEMLSHYHHIFKETKEECVYFDRDLISNDFEDLSIFFWRTHDVQEGETVTPQYKSNFMNQIFQFFRKFR